MGKKYNGGIPTPTSISVNKAEPSNDREIVENLSDLLTLEYAYPLMKVVVEGDGNTYQWVGGAQNDLSNWVDEVTVIKNGLSSITKGEGLVFETRAAAIAAPITPDELDPFTVYNESGFNGQYAFTSGNADGYILISLFVNEAEVGDSMEGSSKYFDGDKTINRIREELFDTTPTSGSTNAVESGGVKVAIDSVDLYPFLEYDSDSDFIIIRDMISKIQLVDGFDKTRKYGLHVIQYKDGTNPNGILIYISDLTTNPDYSSIIFGYSVADFTISTDKSNVYELIDSGKTIRIVFDVDKLPASINNFIKVEFSSDVFSNKIFTDTEFSNLITIPSTIASDISTLQGEISTANSNITTLQSDVNTAESDILILQNDVIQLETIIVNDITTLTPRSEFQTNPTTYTTGTTLSNERFGFKIPANYNSTVEVIITATTNVLTGPLFWEVTGIGNVGLVTINWVSDGVGGFYFQHTFSASTYGVESEISAQLSSSGALGSDVTVEFTEIGYLKSLKAETIDNTSRLDALDALDIPTNIKDAFGIDWKGYASMTPITVKLDGSGDFLTIQEAINSVTDATVTKQYDIQVFDDITITDVTDLWVKSTPNVKNTATTLTEQIAMFITKNFVHVRGMNSQKTLFIESPTNLDANSYQYIQVIYPQGNVILNNFKVVIKGGRYAIHQEAGGSTSSPDYQATTIYKNMDRVHLGNFTSYGYPAGAWSSIMAQADGTTGGFKRYDIDGSFTSPYEIPFYFHSDKDFDDKTEHHFINCDMTTSKAISLSNYNAHYSDIGSGQRALIEFIGCNIPKFKIENGIRCNETVMTKADLWRNGGADLIGYGNSPMLANEEIPTTFYFEAITAGHDIEITGGTAYDDIFGGDLKKYAGSVDKGGEVWGVKRIVEPNTNLGDSRIFSLPYRLGNCATVNKTLIVRVNSVDYTITFDQNYMTAGGGAYSYNTVPNISTSTIINAINALHPTIFSCNVSELLRMYSFTDCMEKGINSTATTIERGRGVIRDVANGVNCWRISGSGEKAQGISAERINPATGEVADTGEIILIKKAYFRGGAIGGLNPTAGSYYRAVGGGFFIATTDPNLYNLYAIDADNVIGV